MLDIEEALLELVEIGLNAGSSAFGRPEVDKMVLSLLKSAFVRPTDGDRPPIAVDDFRPEV
jgi:hypothetical protein